MTIQEINSKNRSELADIYLETWGVDARHQDYNKIATALYMDKRIKHVNGVDLATYQLHSQQAQIPTS